MLIYFFLAFYLTRSQLFTYFLPPLGLLKKSKSINRRERNPDLSGYAKNAKNLITAFYLCDLCAFTLRPLRLKRLCKQPLKTWKTL
jgi:hypothetical protein